MPPARLVILGSSAGLASAHRASSCYLLDLGAHGVLMDCGDGATANFLANGYEPAWVDEIVITHTHADHVCGLPYFLQQRYLAGTSRPLTIRCPAEAVEPLQTTMTAGYLFRERFSFPLAYVQLLAGQSVDCAGAHLTPHATSHLAAPAAYAREHGLPHCGQCYAIRVEIGGVVIVYSSDLGSLDDLDDVPLPVDWLLVETSHVPLERLWSWVEARGIRRVILTHLSDDFDAAAVLDARRQTVAEVLIAEDNMALDITA